MKLIGTIAALAVAAHGARTSPAAPAPVPLAKPPSAAVAPAPAAPARPPEAPASAAAPKDGWSGPLAATAKAEHSEVRLGEPVVVTVEIKHAKGEKWSLSPAQKFEPFQLRGQSGQTLDSGDAATTRLSLTLSLFQLGPHAVPDLQLQASSVGPQGAAHTFALPGPVLKGMASSATDKDRRDIKPPVAYEVENYTVLFWIAGGLAALALALLAWRAWRQRPKRERAPLVPLVPEDQRALESLAALEAEGLPGRGQFKEFHLRLSEILRGYLSERYQIHALDMTSEELYHALARLPTEGLSLADLAWICAQGDLAKFAKGAPTVDDCKQALQLVRQLVRRTKRRQLVDGDTPLGSRAQGVSA